MIAIISLLVALSLSLLITRVATVALTMTGLSHESAKFQARSAFSGVGFTTKEAESIVGHPVRRRIAMLLMLLGNLGIATVVATMMVSLIDVRQGGGSSWNLVALLGGLLFLMIFSRSHWLDRRLNRLITWSLKRWTSLDVKDYVAILHVSRGYVVSELLVAPGDWLEGKTLMELNLPAEGLLILGIHRKDGNYVGVPKGSSIILANDTLILYGAGDKVEELDNRRAGRQGDAAHEEAASGQSPEREPEPV